ncbi:hypothetical protein P3G55_02295 [Leptospira sp. 96542]|nr:hypothetical protein [Leptospira sp. 96542]
MNKYVNCSIEFPYFLHILFESANIFKNEYRNNGFVLAYFGTGSHLQILFSKSSF